MIYISHSQPRRNSWSALPLASDLKSRIRSSLMILLWARFGVGALSVKSATRCADRKV